MLGFDQIISRLGNGYTSGSAYEVLGKTIPGSEIDWAFAEQDSYAVLMELGVGQNQTSHVDAIIGLVSLPPKLALLTEVSKSLLETVHSLPQIFAVILLLVCGIVVVLARFYGYSLADLITNVKERWREIGMLRICVNPDRVWKGRVSRVKDE
jgi:hypothetical protein